MAILWCGGEDIDFPDTVSFGNQGSTYVRTGYARHSFSAQFPTRSIAFEGGAITTGWFSCQAGMNSTIGSGSSTGTVFPWLGLVSGATTKGIHMGLPSTNSNCLAVFKYDGTTYTELCRTNAQIFVNNASLSVKVDVEFNYNASGYARIYINGILSGSFTGDTTIATVSNLDRVCTGFPGTSSNNRGMSEVIVADEDTRAMSLVTMAPNAAGDANAWTGAYTDVNEQTISDTTVLVTNSTGQDVQVNLTDLPTGTFTVKAVQAVARATATAGSTPTNVALGFKSGGTIGAGTARSLNASFQTVQQMHSVNPATSSAWVQSDMNALQLNLRSS